MNYEEEIQKVILEFAWWNYGLDNVNEADAQDWARDLATDIVNMLYSIGFGPMP